MIADLSNRPYLCNGLVFREETIGNLSAEVVDHLFMSVAANALDHGAHRQSPTPAGGDEADVAEAATLNVGKWSKQCVALA